MDEFNSTFGRLSTNAAEWKPPSSDLNAGAVKEFIPGHGWATTDGSGQQQQGRPRIVARFFIEIIPFSFR
jgi:hypothetical protein